MNDHTTALVPTGVARFAAVDPGAQAVAACYRKAARLAQMAREVGTPEIAALFDGVQVTSVGPGRWEITAPDDTDPEHGWRLNAANEFYPYFTTVTSSMTGTRTILVVAA